MKGFCDSSISFAAFSICCSEGNGIFFEGRLKSSFEGSTASYSVTAEVMSFGMSIKTGPGLSDLAM